jgi:hypothetical protein
MAQWLARCNCGLFILRGGRVRLEQLIIVYCLEDRIFSFALFSLHHIAISSNISTQPLICLDPLFLNSTGFGGNYSSFLMAIIVEKSKKCLDFGFTLFVVHFLIVCVYDGFPSTWDWWIVHICSMVTMVLLGEYLCTRREMEDIPLLQI